MQTILVVEDELPIAEMLVDILEDTDYHVVVVSNGQEALASLKTTHPDLILSDVMMPIMDGRALCKNLKSNSAYSLIPIVLMSAVYNPATLNDCGHDAFLKKPFEITDLLVTVSKVLSRSRNGHKP